MIVKTRFGLAVILALSLLQLETRAQQKKDTTGRAEFREPFENPQQFPGGSIALVKFFNTRLHKIAGAKNKKVFISFVVEKDGTLSDFKIMRGLGKEADNEALRVIKLSPKWKPASQNGVVYKVSYTLPIVFIK